jgi:carboxypeptidase family protein/TonB-dependent receptor-like protein
MRRTIAWIRTHSGELVARALLTASLGLLVISAAGMAQTPAAATGSIAGIVRDSTGLRLNQVAIGVVGTSEQRAASNDSGVYHIAAIGVGATKLFARRVGYAPETLSVAVVAGQLTNVDFVLTASVHTLPEATVIADPTRGKMGPFNRRKSRGVGAFFTRAEIEKRQPASISELLRYLPGVGVTQKMAGEPQPVHMERSVRSSMQATCVVQLYVDGHPYPNGNVDDFSPGLIEGVEVYRSASEIPADFRTRDATCGLIALWTRDPEAARRKP